MAKLHKVDEQHIVFHCPGCDSGHMIPISGPHAWGWNGSMDAPTFTPSILVRNPANPNALEEFKEWRTERRCHSFVRDGHIQYLTDSTHKLSGQTVPIPDWEDS
jgi:hypothetical protein